MSNNKILPILSGLLLLSSCSSKFDTEQEAIAACQAWASEEGTYTINLLMPSSSSNSYLTVLTELGKNYEDNWFAASMTLANSFGTDSDGVYKIELYKRDCYNKAANFDGVAEKFSITGRENKNFKTGEVFTLNAMDYSKYAGGDYRFKPKDLKKFANKVQDLIVNRADYKDAKEFEF